MSINEKDFTINCTGDVCSGDIILFTEAVFNGSYKKPVYAGDRRIAARVLKESYGAEKQQHTFILEILASDGKEPLSAGAKTRRKGRNIYKNGTLRMAWANEDDRGVVLEEKHDRGSIARAERAKRRFFEAEYA